MSTRLETVRPIRLRCNGQERDVPAQTILTLSEVQAERLLRKAPGCVRPLAPTSPLQPGWRVAYRTPAGQLLDGIVDTCRWTGASWVVLLAHGDAVLLAIIVSVGQTDAQGKVCAAWTVRAHGYDGEGAR